MEDADVLAVAVEHLDGQHEVLPLVRVGDVKRLGGAVVLKQTIIGLTTPRKVR